MIPETKWLVEPATPEDRIAISHLNVWAHREFAMDLGETAWPELVKSLTAPAEPPARVLLVREDDGLLGSVTYRPPGTSHPPLSPGWASIDRLAVSPEARQAGVASELVQACINLARADGAEIIGAQAANVMSAAQGLLRSLGFHREQALTTRNAPTYCVYRKSLE